MKVLVIGGGIGGLCLAQGLRGAGVPVEVYERNRVRDDWLQGYRLNISPHGSQALSECLPADLWDTFLATAGKSGAGFGFLTEQLEELLFLDRDLISGTHYSVSRITLRQVLLGGMDDVVRYGKEFVRYEQTPDGKVIAFFADGSSATGDVLVAADGANSRVRQQYLPHAQRIDTGVVTIAGKLALTDETRAWLPDRLVTSVNNILPPKDSSLFVAVWEGDQREVAAPAGMPQQGLLFDTMRDYMLWGYSARRDAYPEGTVDCRDGVALRGLVQSMISGWHPDLVRLVASSDPETVASVRIRSAAPVEPWPTTNVTLLGDAIHNMTPMAGIGANTALRDARLLCHRLTAVDRGQASTLAAIREYEAEMLDYGFAAVKLSLRNARQAVSGSRASRMAFKTVLRTVNAIHPAKRRMARGFGS